MGGLALDIVNFISPFFCYYLQINYLKIQINNYEPRIIVHDFFIEHEQHNAEINLKYSLKSNPQEILTYQKTIRRIR